METSCRNTLWTKNKLGLNVDNFKDPHTVIFCYWIIRIKIQTHSYHPYCSRTNNKWAGSLWIIKILTRFFFWLEAEILFTLQKESWEVLLYRTSLAGSFCGYARWQKNRSKCFKILLKLSYYENYDEIKFWFPKCIWSPQIKNYLVFVCLKLKLKIYEVKNSLVNIFGLHLMCPCDECMY